MTQRGDFGMRSRAQMQSAVFNEAREPIKIHITSETGPDTLWTLFCKKPLRTTFGLAVLLGLVLKLLGIS